MAACADCGQEMSDRLGCTDGHYDIADGRYPRVPFGDPDDLHGTDGLTHCHDCAVPLGGFHHPGCDSEACPICKCQAISCGCGERCKCGDDIDEHSGPAGRCLVDPCDCLGFEADV